MKAEMLKMDGHPLEKNNSAAKLKSPRRNKEYVKRYREMAQGADNERYRKL